MANAYRDLFEAELDAHSIMWCQGNRWRSPGAYRRRSSAEFVSPDEAEWNEEPCRSARSKAGRHSSSGGAWAMEDQPFGPTIHMGREVHTRYGLQIALHEVAHVVLGHTERTASGRRKNRQRVFEREAAAEAWSFERMEELAVPVPEKSRLRAAAYISYRKRRGDRVIAAQMRALRDH
jgi:hypothetical protein